MKMNKLLHGAMAVGLLLAAEAALAERVYVKARGHVDLAPFRCEALARSDNLKRLCYDEREQYVLVSVKGVWYHYCGVPAETVSAWKRARSTGRYYNDKVREKFDCQPMQAPTYQAASQTVR